MRAEPDFSAPIVTDLRVGDRLQVLGATADGGWLQALHPATGLEGWVRKELLNLLVPLVDLRRKVTSAPTGAPGTPTAPPGSGGR
jgi:hypothetical protein